MAVKVFSPLREPAPASRPSLMRNDGHHPGSSARLCRSPAERRHPFLIHSLQTRNSVLQSLQVDRISSVLMVSDIGGGINLAVHVNDVQYQTHAPPGRYAPLRIFARNLLPRPHLRSALQYPQYQQTKQLQAEYAPEPKSQPGGSSH